MNDLSGLHAIGYCRVSTDDKSQTNETQKRLIEQWADKNGVIIDAFYMDEVSGGTFPRAGLSSAMVDLMAGQASILVCYDQSRLTRNAAEHLPLIKKIIKGAVIRYVVNGDMSPDSAAAQIVDAIKGVTDSEERRVLKEKTKQGMKTRQLAGQHVGRPARFMFSEDVDGAPRGCYQAPDGTVTDGAPSDLERARKQKSHPRGTVLTTRAKLLEYASLGWSVNFVATHILHISPQTLTRAMRGDREKGTPDITEEYARRYNQARRAKE